MGRWTAPSSVFLRCSPHHPQGAAGLLHPQRPGRWKRPHLCPAHVLSQAGERGTDLSSHTGVLRMGSPPPLHLLTLCTRVPDARRQGKHPAYHNHDLHLFRALRPLQRLDLPLPGEPPPPRLTLSRPSSLGGSCAPTVTFFSADQADIRDRLPQEPHLPLLRARVCPGAASGDIPAAPAEGLPDGEPGGAR